MRIALALILTLALTPLYAHAAQTGPAPADEYFGSFKMSILEIRNRITSFEHRNDSDVLADANATIGLDNVEDAIADWAKQYPRDTWVPKMLYRLIRCYGRAHAQSAPRAMLATSLLIGSYADSEEATAIMHGLALGAP